MENTNRKQVGSTPCPSSFTNDLFGAKDFPHPPSSTGTFSSIFPSPSAVLAKSNSTELIQATPRRSTESQPWNKETRDDINKTKTGASYCTSTKEKTLIFQQRAEPCPLSSSLYYGSQEDMYMQPSNAQKFNLYPDFKKDGVEDDQNGNNSHGASRGNWWQGSLYY